MMINKAIILFILLPIYATAEVSADVYGESSPTLSEQVNCYGDEQKVISQATALQCSAMLTGIKNTSLQKLQKSQLVWNNDKLDHGCSHCFSEEGKAKLSDKEKMKINEFYTNKFFGDSLERFAKVGQILLKSYIYKKEWADEVDKQNLDICLPGNYTKALEKIASNDKYACSVKSQKKLNKGLGNVLTKVIPESIAKLKKHLGSSVSDNEVADIVSVGGGASAFMYGDHEYLGMSSLTSKAGEYLEAYEKDEDGNFSVKTFARKARADKKTPNPINVLEGQHQEIINLYSLFNSRCKKSRKNCEKTPGLEKHRELIEMLMYNSLLRGSNKDKGGKGLKYMLKENSRMSIGEKLVRVFDSVIPNLERQASKLNVNLSDKRSMAVVIDSVQREKFEEAIHLCKQAKIAILESCQVLEKEGTYLPTKSLNNNSFNIINPSFYKDALGGTISDDRAKLLYANMACKGRESLQDRLMKGIIVPNDDNVENAIQGESTGKFYSTLSKSGKKRKGLFSHFSPSSVVAQSLGSAAGFDRLDNEKYNGARPHVNSNSNFSEPPAKSNSTNGFQTVKPKTAFNSFSAPIVSPKSIAPVRSINEVRNDKKNITKKIKKIEVEKEQLKSKVKSIISEGNSSENNDELKLLAKKIKQLEQDLELSKLENQKLELEEELSVNDSKTQPVQKAINNSITNNHRASSTKSTARKQSRSSAPLSSSSSSSSPTRKSGSSSNESYSNYEENVKDTGMDVQNSSSSIVLSSDNVNIVKSDANILNAIKTSDNKNVLVALPSSKGHFIQYVLDENGSFILDEDGEPQFIIRSYNKQTKKYELVEGLDVLKASGLEVSEKKSRNKSKWSNALDLIIKHTK